MVPSRLKLLATCLLTRVTLSLIASETRVHLTLNTTGSEITVTGNVGTLFTLEESTDLSNWNSTPNSEIELDSSEEWSQNIEFPSDSNVFYRAVTQERHTPPSIWEQFTDNVEIYQDGNYMVLETDDLPNHSSPYFPSNHPQYESYNGSNSSFRTNPNEIAAQNIVFRIPVNPAEASNKSNTRLGPIGIALNGVVFFNQYAGPNQPLANEIDSFDQYNGHPTGGDIYHYHVEPTYLTGTQGKNALLGILLDGFPVYGPQEDGQTLTSEDLDEYHGHFGPTPEYPDGIYHYHFTADDPYLNGGQYFETPGTQSN